MSSCCREHPVVESVSCSLSSLLRLIQPQTSRLSLASFVWFVVAEISSTTRNNLQPALKEKRDGVISSQEVNDLKPVISQVGLQ